MVQNQASYLIDFIEMEPRQNGGFCSRLHLFPFFNNSHSIYSYHKSAIAKLPAAFSAISAICKPGVESFAFPHTLVDVPQKNERNRQGKQNFRPVPNFGTMRLNSKLLMRVRGDGRDAEP